MARDCRQRGAVMVATLLALILLAALVFYVFNLGRATQQRVVAQQAADATAAGGAGWIARSMNEVALNNLAMARTIALINVMDSAPEAVAHTLLDQRALVEVLDRQLARGTTGWWLENPLTEVLASARTDVTMLEPIDAQLNRSGFDMRRLTWYDAPHGGRGRFWAAMEATDAASIAAMRRLAEAAQLAAIEAGRANLGESADPVALLLPIADDLPYVRGHFDDFEPAVGTGRRLRSDRDGDGEVDDGYSGGLTPQAVASARRSDWHIYRGPYDTVFGWRHEPDAQVYSGGRGGGSPISSPSPGGWQPRTQPPRDYTVYGPQWWMLDRLRSFRNGALRYSRFARRNAWRRVQSPVFWMDDLADIRLSYLWPGGSGEQVVHPEWVTDYQRAVNLAAANASQIRSTRFVVVEIKSRYPRGSAMFGTPGSWAYANTPGSISPRVVYRRGWSDPTNWRNTSKVMSHIWRSEWDYQEDADPSIGLPLTFDAEGNVVMHTVYRIDEIVFAGVDIGEDETVLSPHNFASRADLPAPIDFDHDRIRPDDASRRHYFTFLGVVRQDGRGGLWSRRFDGEDVRPRIALAQVRIFNNHSFDLWTPMWHAQLEPIEDYDDWLAVFRRDGGALANVPQLAGANLGELGDYLESLEPLVEAVGWTH